MRIYCDVSELHNRSEKEDLDTNRVNPNLWNLNLNPIGSDLTRVGTNLGQNQIIFISEKNTAVLSSLP